MIGARGVPTQAPRARLPGPRIEAWAAGCALAVAALAALGALTGARPGADVLPVVGASFEETLRRPAVAAVLAALLLVALAGTVRGARLHWLASRPGPIGVADLRAAGSVPEGLPEALTLRFRRRLAELHLAVPGPQPGAAPGSDFVDLIGSAATAGKNPLAAVAALLRAAWPPHAYEVQATLIGGDDGRCGVSVQVLMLPATATTPTICWARSWDRAIEEAANHAAAFILPRTRAGRRAPWSGWHGYVLPPRLLDAYERGAVLAHDRRYDEALREYYAALRRDPKNLDLRLRIGFILEKLGLALDAVATYQDMCDIAAVRSGDSAPLPRPVRASAARCETIAAYRRAVLLGSAGRFAAQWCRPDRAGGAIRRDAQRRAHRERLRPELESLCATQYAGTRAHATGRTLQALLGEHGSGRRRELLLRELFQLSSLNALRELGTRLPGEVVGEDQTSLTPAAVALSERCVELRLRSTRRLLRVPRDGPPLGLADLDAQLREAGRNARWPTWSERYSAASLYALAIGCPDVEADRDALATCAVHHLQRAVESADSAYVASRRDWLVSEDPDLEDLRPTPVFKRFEVTYFPSAGPAPRRPPGAHDWEMVRYVFRLLATCAERRAALCADDPDGEPEAWELAAAVASDCEHWPTRLRLIEALERWAPDAGPPPYTDYADVALPEGRSVHDAVEDARERLDSLAAYAEHAPDTGAAAWHGLIELLALGPPEAAFPPPAPVPVSQGRAL